MTRLTLKTVEALRAATLRTEGPLLPPTRILSRDLGVSRAIVLHALRFLVAEGLLESSRGRRFEIVKRRKVIPVESPGLSPGNRVYDMLRRRIRDGIYRVGDDMPKASSVCREQGISTRTMARVLSRLTTENIIHRYGSRYMVGSREPDWSSVQVSSPALMVVLGSSAVRWEGICTSSRTRSFGDAFLGEANRRHIRIVNVVGDPSVRNVSHGVVLPSGVEGFRRVIAESDGRYAGTMVIGTSGELGEERDEWIQLLLGAGRPVVLFDPLGDSEEILSNSPLFTHCRHREGEGPRGMVEFAHLRGHRHLLYPCFDLDWQQRRGDHIRAAIRNVDPRMRLTSTCWADEQLWSRPYDSGLVASVSALSIRMGWFRSAIDHFNRAWPAVRGEYAPYIDERFHRPAAYPDLFEYGYAHRVRGAPAHPNLAAHSSLVWSALEVAPALLRQGPTLLVAIRDSWAQTYLRWAARAGVRFPQDLSLISFDNEFTTAFYPLTTVDFGFGDLGYQAFHAVMRDIPIRRDRHGRIDARPFVVDRGSVGVQEQASPVLCETGE